MAVYKDNATGTWRVIYRFTNWKGERKQTQKRGFATKREAQAWEHEAMLKQGAKLDMTFASFFEVYEADKKQRVKESTWESKSHVIRTKILPYFGNRKIAEIEAKDIIAWQNELMAYRDEKGKPYSADYLKTIHAQLTAIFNHAVNFYNLPYNPARWAGTMGNEVPKEMDFWTKEEYLKFSEAMMDKPVPIMPLKCFTGVESAPANCWRLLRLILTSRSRQSQSARHFTDLKGVILSQARKRKRVTVQSKCRHFSVRKCRNISKCFTTFSRTSGCLRSQNPISITKWSEGQSRRA